MVIITEENFYKFALHSLKSKYLVESEFKSLLKHITYIKRLLKKYKDNPKNINVNLLINHFIIIYNEFELRAANEILLYQINKLYYPQLKTILLLLNKVKDFDCYKINSERIEIGSIQTDDVLEKILRKII
jgi:hypothetical protein